MSGNTLVMKFGGTSVGTADAMRQAVQIIQDAHKDWPRLVAVTSALSGVTDLLIKSARSSAQGDTRHLAQATAQLFSMHDAITQELVLEPIAQARIYKEISNLVNEFSNLCNAISVLGEATPRAMDAVASLGERMAVRLLAAAVQAQGTAAQMVEATRLIITDDRFTDAHPDIEATTRQTRQVLEPILDQGQVAVVTGFLSATPEGVTTTLGRGGSDYSAALLGTALSADEVWIWTDVDGVMTADPRVVSQAQTIRELSYREVSELAYFGAKVLHPKTIRPVIEAGIGLRVCNTFNPGHPGSRIVSDSMPDENGRIKAVTAIRKQRLVTVEGRGMLGVPGMAARTFTAVAATRTSVPLITQASSEQSICFAVPADACDRVVSELQKVFAVELAHRDLDRIWATGDVDIVTVVGAGMRNTPGVAGPLFTALGEHHVNIIATAQGSSEVSISLVVDSSAANDAVRAIHSLIVPNEA